MTLSALVYQIGAWSGVVGASLLALLIFSGDTARYFDRFFGMDRIIKFQRKFSLIISLFVALHPTLFILARGRPLSFLVPNFSVIPLALGIVAFYLFVATMIASTLYKRVSYLAWQYIHVMTYVLFFFALYHAYTWGSDAATLAPLYALLALLVCAGAVYRTVYKIRAARRGAGRVLRVNAETTDTFTLHVRSARPLAFRAGQFCFLRLDRDRLYARHPFTVASAPGEDALRFTIKDTGRFTAVARRLAVGDPIYLDGPFGRFTPPDSGQLVFIAGGVGITPFMSIIRDRVARSLSQDITLIYGSKSAEHIIYKNELEQLHAPWLTKVYVLGSAAGADVACEEGYVTGELLSKYVSNSADTTYYICGPEAMKDSVTAILRSRGIPRGRITIEDFFW